MADVALGTHYEEFIRKQLDSGRYSDASEIVRAGLRMLEDFELSREQWLRREIPDRLAAMRADALLGVPADKVFERLDARHAANVAKVR